MISEKVATKIIFENEKIRVWEMTLEPGEIFPEHYHRLPYLVYVYEAAPLELISQDGEKEIIETEVGGAYWLEAGETHSAKNIGTTRFREVLVEIK
ncbi:MAG: cupin domain-containing protein [Gammaproteobacteria bacterium]|nr:MAG: cupin domain-containing protein [Gammaproteobacteria bacterium]UTW42105.1 cupin domain-containing protein [bacterium SCSIO 12844]